MIKATEYVAKCFIETKMLNIPESRVLLNGTVNLLDGYCPDRQGFQLLPVASLQVDGDVAAQLAIGLDGVTNFFPFAQVVRQVAKNREH